MELIVEEISKNHYGRGPLYEPCNSVAFSMAKLLKVESLSEDRLRQLMKDFEIVEKTKYGNFPFEFNN